MPEPAGSGRAAGWRKLESVALVAVALHSYAVGAMLLFATAWTLRFAGWGDVDPLFFPRQAGAFHFVAATVYLWEYFRHGTVTMLLMTKSVAVVFLLLLSAGQSAWSIPFSGAFDGLMLVGMFLLHRWAHPRRPA